MPDLVPSRQTDSPFDRLTIISLSSEDGELRRRHKEAPIRRLGILRPRACALLFTALTTIGASWYGIVAILGGQWASFDPRLFILWATLVAIIWYATFTYQVVEATRDSAQATRKLAELQEARTEAHGTWLAQILAEHMYRIGGQAVVWRWYDEETHEERSRFKEEGRLARSRQEETISNLEKLEEDLPEMIDGAKIGYPRAAGVLSSEALHREINKAKIWIPQLGESYADFDDRMDRFRDALEEIVDIIGGATRQVSKEHYGWGMSIIQQLDDTLQAEMA